MLVMMHAAAGWRNVEYGGRMVVFLLLLGVLAANQEIEGSTSAQLTR